MASLEFSNAADVKLLEDLLPPALNETLREITLSIYLELLDDAQIVEALGKERIAEMALMLTDRVSRDVGGSTFYMPKGISFRMAPRDVVIGSRYNGRNRRELAQEYGLCDMRIDQIYKRWLASERAKRQGQLDLDH